MDFDEYLGIRVHSKGANRYKSPNDCSPFCKNVLLQSKKIKMPIHK